MLNDPVCTSGGKVIVNAEADTFVKVQFRLLKLLLVKVAPDGTIAVVAVWLHCVLCESIDLPWFS